jgi:hypothetical protein
MDCKSPDTNSLESNLAKLAQFLAGAIEEAAVRATCRIGVADGREEASGHPLDSGGGRATVGDQSGAPRQRGVRARHPLRNAGIDGVQISWRASRRFNQSKLADGLPGSARRRENSEPLREGKRRQSQLGKGGNACPALSENCVAHPAVARSKDGFG